MRLLALVLALSACGAPDRGPPCAPGTICTIAGTGRLGIGDDGLSAHATELYLPADVAIGPDGRTYVVDFNNHRVLAIGEDGIARVVAGTGEIGDGPPGPARESAMLHPSSVAFDGEGRMVVAAWHNYRVKRVDLAAGTLEDIAGTGEVGYAGDGGAAVEALFDLPAGVAVDADGGVIVADQGNQVLRRIARDGTIERIAGQCIVNECAEGESPAHCAESDRRYCGGDAEQCGATCRASFEGDGGVAIDARFSFAGGASATPSARIAIGPDGSIYVADTLAHRVRRVAPSGIVTTVAGTGERGTEGDGGPATEARLDGPSDVAVASDGTIYIADTGNSCVRAVDPAGILRTVAGRCGERGASGDGGAPEDALLDMPLGIDVDARGRLFIADTHNHRVRLVEPRQP